MMNHPGQVFLYIQIWNLNYTSNIFYVFIVNNHKKNNLCIILNIIIIVMYKYEIPQITENCIIYVNN